MDGTVLTYAEWSGPADKTTTPGKLLNYHTSSDSKGIFYEEIKMQVGCAHAQFTLDIFISAYYNINMISTFL